MKYLYTLNVSDPESLENICEIESTNKEDLIKQIVEKVTEAEERWEGKRAYEAEQEIIKQSDELEKADVDI